MKTSTRKMQTAAAIVGLTVLCGSPVVAQTTSGSGTGTTGTTGSTMTRTDTRDDRDWGWVGLLGLVGLAGLMRRDRNDVTTRSTTTPR